MPIDISTSPPVALFFFAHQDDEYGVYQSLANELSWGRRVICVYFTDGGFSGVSVLKRNQESVAVLTQIGVPRDDILFIGQRLSIPDGKLIDHMAPVGQWLNDWLAEFPAIESVYVPAWEGGHHDHDTLHALAVLTAQKLGMIAKVRQFSLYNAYKRIHPFFRVKAPLRENGPVTSSRIDWGARLRYLRFCASYPSQLTTWLGLFPFVLWHYLFNGSQALQAVDTTRLGSRPHAGALYYERRRFCTWEKMQKNIQNYRRLSEQPSDAV